MVRGPGARLGESIGVKRLESTRLGVERIVTCGPWSEANLRDTSKASPNPIEVVDLVFLAGRQLSVR